MDLSLALNPNEFVLDFTQFLKEYNVVGLGIGTLVSQNTMEMGKSFVDAIVMPLVTGVITRTTPTISYYSVIQSMITFIVTMFVIFAFMRIFGVKLTKPVSYVRVVNEGYSNIPMDGTELNEGFGGDYKYKKY